MNFSNRIEAGHPSRRDLGRLLLGGSLVGAVAACRPPGQGYPLEAEGQAITDKPLPNIKHPYLESIKFTFDPNRAGGSLVMAPTFRGDSEFKLISEETDEIDPKNPGFIYCNSDIVRGGIPDISPYFPVIRFGPNEEYRIYLGFRAPKDPCLAFYEDMRTYYLTRDSRGQLSGRFEGLKTIDPTPPSNLERLWRRLIGNPILEPRDPEAAQSAYWQTGCLP
jgi:hypothetical protein